MQIIPNSKLIKKRYTKLTDIGYAYHNYARHHRLLICDCGNFTIKSLYSLKAKRTKSCGCIDKYHNIIGKRFGRLKILDNLGIKNNRTRLLCLCNCGKVFETYAISVKRGLTKSCGCSKKPYYTELHSIKRAYKYIKKYAINRGKTFSLTLKQYEKICFKNCIYCDAKPSNLYTKSNTLYKFIGLDRVDSSIGYTKNNVVPCCIICNRMKNNLNLGNWLKHMKKILKTFNIGLV